MGSAAAVVLITRSVAASSSGRWSHSADRPRQRRVQKLVHQAVEGLADFVAIMFVQFGQLVEQALQLFFLGPLPSSLELLDDRAGRAVVQVAHEAARFLLDDLQCGRQLLVARQAVALARLAQIVDGHLCGAQHLDITIPRYIIYQR